MKLFQTAVLIVVLVALLIGCGAPLDLTTEAGYLSFLRPIHHGLALPFPMSIPGYKFKGGARPYTGMELAVTMTLRIDSDGLVQSVETDSKTFGTFVRHYTDYLKSIRFEPGVVDSVESPMWLEVRMWVSPELDQPHLIFPVAANCAIVDADLYFESLAMNGIEWAYVETFPSYFSTIRLTEVVSLYPYLLFYLKLDSTGHPVSVEPVISTGPSLTTQVQSATLWAKYQPLRIDGQAVASSGYLLVSIFAPVGYPSKPIGVDSINNLTMLDKLRVRLIPDTVGLMAPPIPALAWNGEVYTSHAREMSDGIVSTRVFIDTLGNANLLNLNPDAAGTRRVVHMISNQLRFYPALDFHGGRHPYEGLIHLQRESDTAIRIWFDWLPEIYLNQGS